MNTVLYTGVTSELHSRIPEHRERNDPRSFTSRYRVFKLVYFENFTSIEEAIYREKQIKGWLRSEMIALIDQFNPAWDDLYDRINEM